LEEETVTKGQLYLSFVNRAIAYKFMGKDKEAQNDVNQAVT